MIDEKTQAELRAKYNPDGSDLRNMQLRMLEMLKYIDKICRENDIKYWLSSGTCLGAVRHGGFIPWDDDVDIEMLKPDFKKLKKAILADKDCPYDWQDAMNDEYYPRSFAKLRDKHSEIEEGHSLTKKYKYKGLFIDIFIITPSNSLFLRRISASIYARITGNILKINTSKLRKLCKFILNCILVPMIDCCQYLFANGTLRQISGSYFFKPRRYADIQETKYINFEDTKLPVPLNAESYLTKIYGHYNNLPDIIPPRHIAKYQLFNRD